MLESMQEELRCLHRVSEPGYEPAGAMQSYHDSDDNSSGSTDGGFALQTINANHPPATATVAPSSGSTRARPPTLGPLEEEVA